jgi:hypothetical protein
MATSSIDAYTKLIKGSWTQHRGRRACQIALAGYLVRLQNRDRQAMPSPTGPMISGGCKVAEYEQARFI